MKTNSHRKSISSFRVILLGFIGVIVIGTLLLMLPIAVEGRGHAGFLDALFTSTSATCVTGLTVHDTAAYWSTFGHVIILILVQVGGIGVVTVAGSLSMIVGKRIGIVGRTTMQDAMSAHEAGGIAAFTKFILKGCFIAEAAGAVCLCPSFIKTFGVAGGIWRAVFTSVSSFCNAGFDLTGDIEPGSSLYHLSGFHSVLVVISLLTILGGLGFMTWEDMAANRLRIRRYKLQSKVILTTYVILTVVPFVILFFLEFRLPQWAGLSLGERIYAAIFQSVSARSSGFTIINMANLSEPGQMLIIILMLIGGSPGSTAGGIKTTTIAVLLLTALAVFQRKEQVNVYGRRIKDDVAKTATAILFMYLSLAIIGAMVISYTETLPLLTCLFETSAAISTAGISLGITSGLHTISRIILIVFMYAGRVGCLTIIYSSLSRKRNGGATFPHEKIVVG